MNKFIDITKSWITSMNPTLEQKELADSRATICDSCPSLKYNKYIDIYFCGECGCPINKKIYTSNKNGCPLNKWTR